MKARARNRDGLETENASPVASFVTMVEEPTSVFFDEVSSDTISASAYTSLGFTNLQLSTSGVNIAINTAYAGWHT